MKAGSIEQQESKALEFYDLIHNEIFGNVQPLNEPALPLGYSDGKSQYFHTPKSHPESPENEPLLTRSLQPPRLKCFQLASRGVDQPVVSSQKGFQG